MQAVRLENNALADTETNYPVVPVHFSQSFRKSNLKISFIIFSCDRLLLFYLQHHPQQMVKFYLMYYTCRRICGYGIISGEVT